MYLYHFAFHFTMKTWHSITLCVFSKEEEDYEKIKEKFASLFPFDLEEEKITLKKSKAIGFHELPIFILEVVLTKEKHTSLFLEHIKEQLSSDQKNLLLRQTKSRLDENNCFFIRFDKQKLLENNELFIVDHGNCFHLKIHVAAFPAKRERGLEIIENFLKTQKD